MTRTVRERIDPQVRARLDRLVELVGPQGLAGIEDIAERRQRQAELTATVGRRPMPEDVELHVHTGAIHGGESLAPEAALSVRARTLRVEALQRALAP